MNKSRNKIIKDLFAISLFLLASTSCNNDPPSVPSYIDLNIQDCLLETSNAHFEVLTWNLKEFPLIGSNTITEFAEIVQNLDADLIVIQEIGTKISFDQLIDELQGWSGDISISGNLNLAFIYKDSEVLKMGSVNQIFKDDPYAFPRPPAIIEVSYAGKLFSIINIHLKCCGGEENFNRRQSASEKLKSYIDENLFDKSVIVLGDFNDLISDQADISPFSNFILDSLNYMFTDMDIALTDENSWSYPSWPSHIDHILITNELFEDVKFTQTLSLDICDNKYLQVISDHRPILLQLGD